MLTLGQLPKIAKLLTISEEGYKTILEVILPVISSLLNNFDDTIVGNAVNSLAIIAKMIKDKDKGDHILTIVLSKYKIYYR